MSRLQTNDLDGHLIAETSVNAISPPLRLFNEGSSAELPFATGDIDFLVFRALRSIESRDFVQARLITRSALRAWAASDANTRKRRFDALTLPARLYLYKGEIEKAENSAKQFAQRDELEAQAAGTLELGVIYYHRGQFSRARDYFDGAKWLCRKLASEKGILYASILGCRVDIALGRHGQIIQDLEHCLSEAKRVEEPVLYARAYHDLGVCYGNAGRLDVAMSCFETSHRLFLSLGESTSAQAAELGIAQTRVRKGHSNLGDLSLYQAPPPDLPARLKGLALEYSGDASLLMGDLSEALRKYRRSLALAKKADADHNVSEACQRICTTWILKKDLLRARRAYDRAKQALAIAGLERDRLIAKRLRAELIYLEGRPQESLRSLQSVAHEFVERGYSYEYLVTAIRIAAIAEDCGDLTIASSWKRRSKDQANRSSAETLYDLAFSKDDSFNIADKPDLARFGIVTRSKPLQDIADEIQLFKGSEQPVLIQGETGTGKELFAKLVHASSLRSKETFLPLNIAAIPSEMFEDCFFGHLKGAFTGAHSDSQGAFRAAHSGILFLDEIGELPLDKQPKLLRAIETGEVFPLGGSVPCHVDVRIVAATNQDLQKQCREGRFRWDLFYRLNSLFIELPPLRDRKEDILPLVEHFLGASHQSCLSATAANLLLKHHWPGNVRELENTIQAARIRARGKRISAEHFVNPLGQTKSSAESDGSRARLVLALEQERGNILRTAKRLGVSRTTVYRLVENYGIKLAKIRGL